MSVYNELIGWCFNLCLCMLEGFVMSEAFLDSLVIPTLSTGPYSISPFIPPYPVLLHVLSPVGLHQFESLLQAGSLQPQPLSLLSQGPPVGPQLLGLLPGLHLGL